jgi:hypothetical protein
MDMDKEKRPGESDKDKADVEEVVSDFGDVRLRSQFEVTDRGSGVLGINIFGPILEFSDGEDDDLEEHEQPESQS